MSTLEREAAGTPLNGMAQVPADRSRRRFLLTSVLLAAGWALGCSNSNQPKTPDLVAWPQRDQWPQIFWQAPPETKDAYRYAVAHPEELQYMPCFCGCVNDGHASNKDCYVREFRPDGSVLLEVMSFG